MSMTRISGPNPASQLHVEQTVTRKTPREETRSFGRAMRAGAGIVLRGVEVGATVVGGPIMGAAVRTARVGVEAGIGAGSAGAGIAGGPLGLAGAAGASEEGGTLAEVRAMQEQAQSFNLQYLALQEEVQQENRRFTTVSNVLKAKHETAKSAIANIRS